MDILAARKKAAEQASARNKSEPRPGVAAQPKQEPEAQRVPAKQPTGATVETPAAVSAPAVGPIVGTAVNSQAVSVGDQENTRQQEIELLSFRLGGEEYAVRVAQVREVLKVVQMTIVPNSPDYVLGVASLRGTMLPIIDLCRRFGLPPGVADERSRIVVVSCADGAVGLQVDRVTGVLRIFPEAIRPAPENIEQGAEFLGGIVRKDDRLYILLDLEKAVGV